MIPFSPCGEPCQFCDLPLWWNHSGYKECNNMHVFTQEGKLICCPIGDPGAAHLVFEHLSSLTFKRLAEINITRCRRWHDPNAWSLERWAMSAAGEMGEACNAIKKLLRHDDGLQQHAVTTERRGLVQNVAMEIGDVVVYLDLLAQRMGLTLEDCVRNTFNRISVREGFPERL